MFEMSYELSQTKFSKSFLLLVKKVHRSDDDIEKDNMRIGEPKYNTLYDHWKKLKGKKRVHPESHQDG